MPTSNSNMIRKLQFALNTKGLRILCNRSQFYSEQQQRPVTIYKVNQAILNPETGKNRSIELFKSVSEIQIVLFLRNLWCLVQGKEIPETNHLKGADEFQAKWDEFEKSWSPPDYLDL